MASQAHHWCVVFGVMAAMVARPASSQGPFPLACNPGNPQAVFQSFPSPAPVFETAWCVLWQEVGHKGLQIGGAWFKRGPNEPWMQILNEAGLVEIFVPYHSGLPRFEDLQCGCLQPVLPGDGGTGLGNPPVVVRELRDRGVVWKSDCEVRRGEELLLWGTYDSGNYDYLMQYGFRDDGTITFRLGATGYNNPDFHDAAHMHSALWRIDVDLAGSGSDRALVTHHLEDPAAPARSASDHLLAFATEFAWNWIPEGFTSLRVEDLGTLNAHGGRRGYDLVPLRTGTARHNASFSHADFRVTVFDKYERDLPKSCTPPCFRDISAAQVPGFVNGGSLGGLAGANIVLWHVSSAHHDPHDEDDKFTLANWSGFDLVPHDLFDSTPLFSSCRASDVPGSSLTNYQVIAAAGASSQWGKNLIVKCPPNTSALGGGAAILGRNPGGAALSGSVAFPFDGPTGWLGEGMTLDPMTQAWALQTSVICGNVTCGGGTSCYSILSTDLEGHPRCPCGKAVLGGGALVGQPLLAIAPEDPTCPSLWAAVPKRAVPKSIICGNVPGYEVVSLTTNSGNVTSKMATVSCPPGKVVLSGGVKILGNTQNKRLLASTPVLATPPALANQWLGSAYVSQSSPTPDSWELRVDAICATFP